MEFVKIIGVKRQKYDACQHWHGSTDGVNDR